MSSITTTEPTSTSRSAGPKGRLTIRRKLGLLVLVPVVVTAVLGTASLAAEAARARDLEATSRLARLAQAIPPAQAALGGLQLELARTTSAAPAGRGTARDAAVDAVDRVRAATTAVAGAGSDRFGRVTADARDALGDLHLDDPRPKQAGLDRAVRALGALAEAIPLEAANAGLARSLAAVASLGELAVVTSDDARVLVEYGLSGMDADRLATLTADRARAEVARRAFDAAAPAGGAERLAALGRSADDETAGQVVDQLISAGPATPAGRVPVDSALQAYSTTLAGLRAQLADLSDAAVRDAEAAHADAVRGLVVHAAALVVALAGTATVTLLVARSISRRLQSVAEAATDIADVRLPRFVQAVHDPSVSLDEAAVLPTLPKAGRDEVGEVVRAFAEVQEVTVAVAREHAERLRDGIDGLFVNLARRNQAALTRQLDALGWLRDHQVLDADAAERLDLAATLGRELRRNADNLLVLSGVEVGANRPAPAELHQVVHRAARQAARQSADLNRIRLVGGVDRAITGVAADDLTRLLVEVLDNAFAFSPPGERVLVSVETPSSGGLVVAVRDHGIGMRADQLAEANAVVAGGGQRGLDLDRRFGLLVMGALARRLGGRVELAAAEGGGVAVRITMPSACLLDDDTEPVVADVATSTTALVDSPPAPDLDRSQSGADGRALVAARFSSVDVAELVNQYR